MKKILFVAVAAATVGYAFRDQIDEAIQDLMAFLNNDDFPSGSSR